MGVTRGSLVALLLVGLGPSSATAQILAGETPPDCADERALRDLLVARLGTDPLTEPGAPSIQVTLWADASGHHARVEVDAMPPRELAARSCDDLFEAVATVLAIALDPAPASPEPPAPPAPADPTSGAVARSSTPVEIRAPVRPAQRRSRVRAWMGIDGVGSVGLAPSPALGASVSAGMRWGRRLRVGLEGALLHTPEAGDLPGPARVRVTVATAAVVPCVLFGAVSACAGVEVGRTEAAGSGMARPASDDALFAAVQARVEIAARVGPVQLHVSPAVVAPLTRPTFAVDDAPRWTAPPLAAALGVGGLFEVP
jgi:hypothetical protein